MGFETEQPTLFYRLNLYVNFIDYCGCILYQKEKLQSHKYGKQINLA
jgi:hypothetical protein